MGEVKIKAGNFTFGAQFEKNAPATVAAFRAAMPFTGKLIHVRWSGEGMWVPRAGTWSGFCSNGLLAKRLGSVVTAHGPWE